MLSYISYAVIAMWLITSVSRWANRFDSEYSGSPIILLYRVLMYVSLIVYMALSNYIGPDYVTILAIMYTLGYISISTELCSKALDEESSTGINISMVIMATFLYYFAMHSFYLELDFDDAILTLFN